MSASQEWSNLTGDVFLPALINGDIHKHNRPMAMALRDAGLNQDPVKQEESGGNAWAWCG